MSTLPLDWLDIRYPTVLPVWIAFLIVATLVRKPLARRLRTDGGVAWLLVASVGGVLALTIAPSRDVLDAGVSGPITCDFSRIGLATLATYARFDDPFLNVLLLVPLGFAIGLLPPGRQKVAIAIGALLLPVAIETTQAVVVALGRACESGDVFDNGLGVLIGLALGVLALRLVRRDDAR